MTINIEVISKFNNIFNISSKEVLTKFYFLLSFEDVNAWYEKCKKLGCRSEYECFLRKPPSTCASTPCKNVPDCIDDLKYCKKSLSTN